MIIAPVARDTDIEDLVRRTGASEGDEGLERLAPLMPGNTSRQAVRGGNIVLSVDSEPVAPTARRITVAIVQAQGSRLRRGGRDVAMRNRGGDDRLGSLIEQTDEKGREDQLKAEHRQKASAAHHLDQDISRDFAE